MEKYAASVGCMTYAVTGAKYTNQDKLEMEYVPYENKGNYMMVGRKKHDV